MKIACPSCGERITAKPPEPGRHKPRCPTCGAKFLIVVPEDPRGTFQIRPLPESEPPEPPTPLPGSGRPADC